jgi:hypothetical protein
MRASAPESPLSSYHLARTGWLALCLILALTAYGVFNHRNIYFDFANFYDAGQKARAGEFATLYDPFAKIAGEKPFGNMPFLSAPMTSLLYVPLTWFPPRTSTVLFKAAGALAEIAGLVLLFLETRRLSGPSPGEVRAFLALFAWSALIFQPFFTFYFVGGQTTPFVFALLVLGWSAFLRGRDGAAALAVGAAVLVKPAFAPAAAVLFLAGGGRFRGVALVFAAAVAGLSLATLGAGLHLDFLRKVIDESAHLRAPWQNSNPLSWLEPLWVPPETYSAGGNRPAAGRAVLTMLQLAAAAAVCAALAATLRRRLVLPAARHAIFSAAFLVAFVLSPIVWSHYLMVLFIPFAALVALRRHLPPWVRAALVTVVLVSVFQNGLLMRKVWSIIPVDTTPEAVVHGLLKSLPALLFLAIALFGRDAIARALQDPAWRELDRAAD